jgi:hypothetical protein
MAIYWNRHDKISPTDTHFSTPDNISPTNGTHFSTPHISPTNVTHFSTPHNISPTNRTHFSTQHNISPTNGTHFSTPDNISPTTDTHFSTPDNISPTQKTLTKLNIHTAALMLISECSTVANFPSEQTLSSTAKHSTRDENHKQCVRVWADIRLRNRLSGNGFGTGRILPS